MQHCQIRSCSFLGCPNPACVDSDARIHDTCGMSHHTQMMQFRLAGLGVRDTSDALSAYIKCRLPNCARHVYVEEQGRLYDYCGQTHAQEDRPSVGSTAEARYSRNNQLVQMALNMGTSKMRSTEIMQALQAKNQGCGGEIPELDILADNPWNLPGIKEVVGVPGYKPPSLFCCFHMQRREGKGKKVKRMTKAGLKWRQSGTDEVDDGLVKRYFYYKSTQDDDEHSDRWKMAEYSILGTKEGHGGEAGTPTLEWIYCQFEHEAQPKRPKHGGGDQIILVDNNRIGRTCAPEGGLLSDLLGGVA